MAGLPKLPGLNFTDPTTTRFHLSQTFNICNGYKMPRNNYPGVGQSVLDANSIKYLKSNDPVRFDPSLTYGRTKAVPLPQFKPHYALYDQKCLTFRAFFKQGVVESPNEYYRIRIVNIIYFLEDNSITVMEPKTPNSGMDQGRLIKRSKVPKTDSGVFYTWKDLAVGKDLPMYGVVFHTVDCDGFTREYMASQGILMAEPEQMPQDPYTMNRLMQQQSNFTVTPSADDRFRRFLEYDGKILRFKALWDDRDSEYGEIRKYEIFYSLADDTIAVKEIHGKNDGRDPYPLLLRKTKLPKIWTDRPVTFPSIYLETSDAEITEYYQPKDLRVGETIFVLGRKMLLYDCDAFTRNYFKKALCLDQSPAMDIEERAPPRPPREIPPHDGLGSLEDSLQNTLTFLPKPPRKDVVKQILNTNKFLRYEMRMEDIHPEDKIRKFILLYSLADSKLEIYEPPIPNSGIIGGKFLRGTLIAKPNTDPLNPTYYSPLDFYVGAVLEIFSQRFEITGADLYVYRYMQANSHKFPCEVIENIRNYLFNEGLLKDDVDRQMKDNQEGFKKAERDAMGTDFSYLKSEYDKCLEKYKIEKHIDVGRIGEVAELVPPEPIRMPEHKQEEFGIRGLNEVCAYPDTTPPVGDLACKDEAQRIATTEYDTEEEKIKKYYDKVLREHKAVCRNAGEGVADGDRALDAPCFEKETKKVKAVRFEDEELKKTCACADGEANN